MRWDAIVDREAADDAALRAEVRKLLAAFRADASRLEEVRLEAGASGDGAERVGSSVASCRLTRLLGRGGMEAVVRDRGIGLPPRDASRDGP